MEYFVNENDVLVSRFCPVMQMVNGDKNENNYRKKANEKAKYRFDKMIEDGIAIKAVSHEHPIDCYDPSLPEGKLVLVGSALRDLNVVRCIQDRRRQYPPIADQLDAIMKWLDQSDLSLPAELKGIVDRCIEVKTNNPIKG